jgi:hypothetical protein
MHWSTAGRCEKHRAMLIFGECFSALAMKETAADAACIARREVLKIMPKIFAAQSIAVRTE